VLIAPVVAGLVFSATIVNDIKTGIYRQLASRISPRYYIKSIIISTIIWGSGVFIFSYLLIFLVIFIYDPDTSVKAGFNRNVLFGTIYDRSMLMYCLTFIGYSCVFGIIYSLVCMGVAMATKSKYMAVGLPFFVYYSSFYGMNIIPVNVAKILYCFIPSLTFDITQGFMTQLMYIGQLCFALVIAVVLIKHSAKNLYNNGYL
jgi:hypothetical protein